MSATECSPLNVLSSGV